MDLNTILIILGVAALIALVAHGLWSNRREKSKYFKNAGTFNRASTPASIQERSTPHQPAPERASATAPHSAPIHQAVLKAQQQPLDNDSATEQADYQKTERTVDDIKISIPNIEPARQPIRMEYQMKPSQPAANPATMTLEQLEMQNDNEFEGINSSSPKLREQLAQMSRGELTELNSAESFNEAPATEAKTPKQTSGYLQLYVISPQYREFHGANLIQSLENLGFIFGRHNMYHRHFDLSVASPTLFSVANLQDDGAFNPYQPEFTTIGVALFMKLPSPGNDLANLKLMIRAAKTLAEDLGGSILTEDEQIFDAVQEQAYLARVV